jgi:hypothetical protein
MARSRGSFGTLTRAIIEHQRTERLAAALLAEECGKPGYHHPGERTDLCPKCQQVAEAEHKEASR